MGERGHDQPVLNKLSKITKMSVKTEGTVFELSGCDG
jgi:hypothetical protein